jgi:PIN domain nuclease of toxin-antitoxin system
MALLLDSNALLWLTVEPSQLASGALQHIDASARLFLSVVSVWELEIKARAGKLDIPADLWDELPALAIEVIAIELADAVAAARLPLHHRDTFDRMIIAQALARGLTIVTRDQAFGAYGIPILAA